ncbi:hypothetical protein D3C81_1588310 [compost metagenome]
MLFSAVTTASRRDWNTRLRSAMKSCGPVSASSAAAWLIDDGFDVLCDCSLTIVLTSAAGAPP